jgi:hypothetical protein
MKQLLPLLLVLLVLLWKKVKAVELRYALRSREDTGRHTKETDAVKRDRSSSRPGPRSLNHNAVSECDFESAGLMRALIEPKLNNTISSLFGVGYLQF